MPFVVNSRIGRVLAGAALLGLAAGLYLAPKANRSFQLGRERSSEMRPLRQELEKRGVKFAVAVAPYRSRAGFQDGRRGYGLAAGIQRRLLISGIRSTGIPVIDLHDSYAAMAGDPANFCDDFHLSESGSRKLAAAAAPGVRALASDLPAGRGKVLIMGECFAVDLALGLQSVTGEDLKVDALRSYDDAVRVADLLLRFEETHLKGCGLVVWFIPDDLLWQGIRLQGFPPKIAAESRRANLRGTVLSDVGFDYRSWDKIKPRLLYPNALGEILVKLEKPVPGVPDTLVGVQYCIRGKAPTGFEGIKTGDTIVMSVQDIDTYFRNHPAVAGEARFKTVGDILLPRFWIEDWTKTAYSTGRW